jgi:hypothetical protein
VQESSGLTRLTTIDGDSNFAATSLFGRLHSIKAQLLTFEARLIGIELQMGRNEPVGWVVEGAERAEAI